MQIILTESYEESASVASDFILEAVREKPSILLGLATGGTVEGIYAGIVKAYREGTADFSRTRTVNLDEYIGCEENDSYKKFMDTHLFDHVNIPKDSITIADYRADPESEVQRLREFFKNNRVDLQLLGIGPNGHIGFNEPGDSLHVDTHIEDLTETTISANARFFDGADAVPKRAITMGMGDIMKARRILLVVHGESKRAVFEQLREGSTVTPNNPSTFLLLHPDVTVIGQR